MDDDGLRPYTLTDPHTLTCAFGWPWLLHFAGPLFACPHCAAATITFRLATRVPSHPPPVVARKPKR